MVSPWTLTQVFFPSSPARLLAKQVYSPASSTLKKSTFIFLSASCVTQQFAWMDDDECDVNFNCDHIHIDVANILIISLSF